MGYSRSRATLEKVRKEFSLLEAGIACKWEGLKVFPGGAERFAYKLREGLFIARLYKDDYPQLAKAAADFSIERVNDDTVQAVPAYNKTTEAVISVAALGGGGTSEVVNQGMAEAGRKAGQYEGPQSAASIIQHWMDAQPSNARFYFPQASLVREELLKLHRWCKSRKPEMFMFESEGSVTLQPYSKDLEGLDWSPED